MDWITQGAGVSQLLPPPLTARLNKHFSCSFLYLPRHNRPPPYIHSSENVGFVDVKSRLKSSQAACHQNQRSWFPSAQEKEVILVSPRFENDTWRGEPKQPCSSYERQS